VRLSRRRRRFLGKKYSRRRRCDQKFKNFSAAAAEARKKIKTFQPPPL
jgi:hypothetical protein